MPQPQELIAEETYVGNGESPEPEAQVPADAPESIPEGISKHCALALQEIEVFWANVFSNVSGRVETSVHNYLHTETEALKARLKSLF